MKPYTIQFLRRIKTPELGFTHVASYYTLIKAKHFPDAVRISFLMKPKGSHTAVLFDGDNRSDCQGIEIPQNGRPSKEEARP